jgi:hypothetical protein
MFNSDWNCPVPVVGVFWVYAEKNQAPRFTQLFLRGIIDFLNCVARRCPHSAAVAIKNSDSPRSDF